jgi:sugar phosphate isomerase/epimerase
MTKFGMPTLIETKTIEECAALCASSGLNFIEMNMNLPQYQVQTMDAGHLAKVAKEYGIGYTIHLDEKELAVAEWHHRGSLPAKDDGISLTREMIRILEEGKEPCAC